MVESPTTYLPALPDQDCGPAVARFTAKVKRTDGCWPWLGGITTSGYGRFWNGEREVAAHRFAYEIHNGLIPDGKELDHLCRNRACVNPSHLEPVDHRTNVLRGESHVAAHAAKPCCPRCGDGYETDARGGRFCRPCRRAAQSAWQKRNKPWRRSAA